MWNLIINEQIKLYIRPRIWVFVGILLIFDLLAAVMFKNTNHTMSEITGAQFAQFISNITHLITIFVAVVAADIIASEFSSGTIKLLLIRPKHRFKILLSKLITILIFVFIMNVWFYGISAFTGLLFFPEWGGQEILQFKQIVNEQSTIPILANTYLIMTYGNALVNQFMYGTIALMIATVFRSNALSIALSIFFSIFGSAIVPIFHDQAWVKYILFANTDLINYATGMVQAQGMTLAFSICVLVVYFIVLNAISFWVFSKRDVTS